MKYKVRKDEEIIPEIRRFAALVKVSTVLDAFVFSALIACIVAFFLLLIDFALSASLAYAAYFIATAIFVILFFVKLRESTCSLRFSALMLDKKLGAEYCLLTLFEMQSAKTNSNKNFETALARKYRQLLARNDTVNIRFIGRPVEFLALIFFVFAVFVLQFFLRSEIMSRKAGLNRDVSVNSDSKKLLTEISRLEANAKLVNDEKTLLLLARLREKILKGKFAAASKLFDELEKKLRETKNNRDLENFIKIASEPSADKRALKKRALALAAKMPAESDIFLKLADAIESDDEKFFSELLKKLKNRAELEKYAYKAMLQALWDVKKTMAKKAAEKKATFAIEDNSDKKQLHPAEIYKRTCNAPVKLTPLKTRASSFYAKELAKAWRGELNFEYKRLNKIFREIQSGKKTN